MYYPNNKSGRTYQIVVNDPIRILEDSPSKIFIVHQSFSTIDTWTNINSIVFTTSSLPVSSCLLSNPHILYDGKTSNTDNGSNFANIITDLCSNQQNYKPQLLYEPASEYRQIELQGDSPLYNISLNVMLKLKNGQLVPFILPVLGSFSMKILFTKKKNIEIIN
jgi:hypothetical protein